MQHGGSLLRGLFVTFATAFALAAPPAALGQAGCGVATSGDCCTPHTTPACSDSACCTLICNADPFCCTTQWDQLCANAAYNQCVVCRVLTETNNGCLGTLLTFPAIAGTTGYAVSFERQLSCPTCVGTTELPTMETYAYPGTFTSTSTSVTLPRTPAFFGRWKVNALNAAGTVLYTLYSPSGVSHPSTGTPTTGASGETRVVDVGFQFTLAATPYATTVTSYQWYRDFAPIPGATGPTYTATMTASHPATATYHCALTNACGGTLSNIFQVNKGSCAPTMVVGLTAHTETETLSFRPNPSITGCEYSYPAVVRNGVCEASFATFTANSITASMSNPTATAARRVKTCATSFTVFVNTNLVLNLSGTSAGFPAVSTVSLTGPVSYTANATVPAPVNRTDLLTPGNYTLTVTLENGSAGCQVPCGTCGPSCIQSCQLLAAAKSTALSAVFQPLSNCGIPTAGACCVAHGTPGCTDATCCNQICASDPFCCNTQWDQICATAASNTCAVCPRVGDLNGDHRVDSNDLAILLNGWGTPAGDLNGDGTTNSSDLALLLNNWG